MVAAGVALAAAPSGRADDVGTAAPPAAVEASAPVVPVETAEQPAEPTPDAVVSETPAPLPVEAPAPAPQSAAEPQGPPDQPSIDLDPIPVQPPPDQVPPPAAPRVEPVPPPDAAPVEPVPDAVIASNAPVQPSEVMILAVPQVLPAALSVQDVLPVVTLPTLKLPGLAPIRLAPIPAAKPPAGRVLLSLVRPTPAFVRTFASSSAGPAVPRRTASAPRRANDGAHPAPLAPLPSPGGLELSSVGGAVGPAGAGGGGGGGAGSTAADAAAGTAGRCADPVLPRRQLDPLPPEGNRVTLALDRPG